MQNKMSALAALATAALVAAGCGGIPSTPTSIARTKSDGFRPRQLGTQTVRMIANDTPVGETACFDYVGAPALVNWPDCGEGKADTFLLYQYGDTSEQMKLVSRDGQPVFADGRDVLQVRVNNDGHAFVDRGASSEGLALVPRDNGETGVYYLVTDRPDGENYCLAKRFSSHGTAISTASGHSGCVPVYFALVASAPAEPPRLPRKLYSTQTIQVEVGARAAGADILLYGGCDSPDQVGSCDYSPALLGMQTADGEGTVSFALTAAQVALLKPLDQLSVVVGPAGGAPSSKIGWWWPAGEAAGIAPQTLTAYQGKDQDAGQIMIQVSGVLAFFEGVAELELSLEQQDDQGQWVKTRPLKRSFLEGVDLTGTGVFAYAPFWRERFAVQPAETDRILSIGTTYENEETERFVCFKIPAGSSGLCVHPDDAMGQIEPCLEQFDCSALTGSMSD